MLHSPPLFRPLKHTAIGKRQAWLSPLVKTLQNCYTDKAVQEFLLRGICRYPVAGLPGVATPGGCRLFRFLASSIPQHHPKINGPPGRTAM